MRLLTRVLLFSLLYKCSLAVPAAQNFARQDESVVAPTVTIDSGVVIGVQTSAANSPNKVNKYLGLPFAASPTRFAPLQTATPWSEPYMATENGPACIQQFNYPELNRNFTTSLFNTPAPPESEDCLHLNIFAPADALTGDKLKPVMFWIYGGGLLFGSNSQMIYDGSSFAANQDVVIVVANYRTNLFGFPSSPNLPLTARNLGYLDQRFALYWVQRNIASFGGDASRVTIFGESAGGFSVDSLVTSFGPGATDGPPPFYAAIMQSGQTSVNAGFNADNTSWPSLIAALNCTTDDDLACARAVPATTLKDIIEHAALSFLPTFDNYTQLQYAEAARRAGQIAKVPVITGTTADEGSIFSFMQNDTESWLRSLSLTETQIQLVLAAYPIGQRRINSPATQTSAIVTDLRFQCPSAIFANDSAIHVPTWRYYFNATFSFAQILPGVDIGAFHGSDVPVVFGTTENYGDVLDSGDRLSELLQNMWATFAKNPAGGPAPGWEEAGSGFVQVIGGPEGVDAEGRLRRAGSAAEIDGRRCEIWRAAYGPI